MFTANTRLLSVKPNNQTNLVESKMSELSLFKGNLPSYLKTVELDEDTKSMMGGGRGGHRISTANGAFSMVVDGKVIATREERFIKVVIVRMAQNDSRTFYEGAYREGETSPPVCWSSDNVRPDSGVVAPQAKTCADCPNNIKGSSPSGEGKACRTSRRLAVVLSDDLKGPIYQFNLPATSVYGQGEPNKWPLKPYVQYLGNNGIPVGAAVTEMKFDLVNKGRINFRPIEPLKEDEFDIIRARAEDPAALSALRLTVSQTDKVALPAPKAKPAPKAVVEDVEDAAPVVKKAKEVEKPAASPDKDAKLRSLIEELDADDEDEA
jgi:hypothetical protein